MALYTDNWCEVQSDGIKIRKYYFPLGNAKFVKLDQLTLIHPTPETSLSPMDQKTWGMGLGKTWWACSRMKDMFSRLANGIVLEDSSWFRHGFSVQDRDAALAAIAKALDAKGRQVPNASNKRKAASGGKAI